MYTMLFVIMMVVIGIVAIGGLVGLAYTSLDAVIDRFRRYELKWDFDEPLPNSSRFLTASEARKHIHKLPDDTEEHLYVWDRKTGKKV